MELQVLSSSQRVRATIDNLRIEATVNSGGSIEAATVSNPDDGIHLASFNSTPDAINYHLTTQDPDTTTRITNAILTFIKTVNEQ